MSLEARDIDVNSGRVKDMDSGRVMVCNGKGGKDRGLWTGDRTLSWLHSRLEV